MKATLRPGADMRARGAYPYRGTQRSARRGRGPGHFGAPSRGPGQLLLPLRDNSPSRALRGGISFAYPDMEMGGSWKASLTLAREARPEGRGSDSQEAGGTLVPPPLVCLRRIAAPFPGRAMRAPTEWTQRLTRRGRSSDQLGAPSRVPGQLLLPLRGNSPSRALRRGGAIGTVPLRQNKYFTSYPIRRPG